MEDFEGFKNGLLNCSFTSSRSAIHRQHTGHIVSDADGGQKNKWGGGSKKEGRMIGLGWWF